MLDAISPLVATANITEDQKSVVRAHITLLKWRKNCLRRGTNVSNFDDIAQASAAAQAGNWVGANSVTEKLEQGH